MPYILQNRTIGMTPVTDAGSPYFGKAWLKHPDGILTPSPNPGEWWTANQNASIFDPAPAGFTQQTLALDARPIHLSPSGNSGNTGLSPSSPIANLDTALNMLRDNMGDWLLFECREDYDWDLYSNFRRSKLRAGVGFGWYGVGPRPRVIPPEAMSYQWNTGHKWVGIHLVNPYGEIGNPLFNGGLTFRNLQYLGSPSNSVGQSNILVEDCESTGVELLFQRQSGPYMSNFTVRHHVGHYVFWANSSNSNSKRPSSSYVNSIDNMLFEYNFHDYSGWHPNVPAGTYGGNVCSGAGANTFNHCYYIGEGWPFAGPTIQYNFISRPSAYGMQLRPGGLGYRNIIYYPVVGVAFGYWDTRDPSKAVLPSGRVARMEENLVLRCNGMYKLPLSCQNNVCSTARWGLQYTIKPDTETGVVWESIGNVVAETSTALNNHDSIPGQFSGKEIWQYGDLYTTNDPTGGQVTRTGNKFWHYTNSTEGDGLYVDPGRSVEGYFSSLAGEPMTYEDVIQIYKSRPKYTLNPSISFPTVHQYIMNGYASV